MKVTKLRAKMLVLFLVSIFLIQSVLSSDSTEAPNENNPSGLNLNQTADMKVVFLGISQETWM